MDSGMLQSPLTLPKDVHSFILFDRLFYEVTHSVMNCQYTSLIMLKTVLKSNLQLTAEVKYIFTAHNMVQCYIYDEYENSSSLQNYNIKFLNYTTLNLIIKEE